MQTNDKIKRKTETDVEEMHTNNMQMNKKNKVTQNLSMEYKKQKFEDAVKPHKCQIQMAKKTLQQDLK